MPSDILTSLLESFLASLQAAFSVLLTLVYGVGASWIGLLSSTAAKEVAHICIEVFQPALIITEIGQTIAEEGSAIFRLWPMLAWGVIYPLVSLALTYPGVRWLGLPSWSLAAVAFNNTTALPLLLVHSLSSTGILDLILPSSSAKAVLSRATTYILLNSMVNNVLTFAIAPRVLAGRTITLEERVRDAEIYPHSLIPVIESADEEAEEYGTIYSPGEGEDSPVRSRSRSGESTPLFRKAKQQQALLKAHAWRGVMYTAHGFAGLPRPVQYFLIGARELLNPPLVGTIIAAVIGLTPPLRRAFFNSPQEGGVLRAWVTSSLQDIGGLYSSLQMFVVGSKLCESVAHPAKEEPTSDEESSTLGSDSSDAGPEQDKDLRFWGLAYILLLRFLVIPAGSIALVYLLATKTDILGRDPLLWFILMLASAGPSAINIASIAEVAGAGEMVVQQIARFLTLSYAISPLISLAVVGALQATAAAKGAKEH